MSQKKLELAHHQAKAWCKRTDDAVSRKAIPLDQLTF